MDTFGAAYGTNADPGTPYLHDQVATAAMIQLEVHRK